MSTLKVDTITNVAGNPDINNVGKILQIVSVHKSDSASTTSTGFVDTGLQASITPSSTSNKILVVADAKMGMASGNIGYVGLFRGSTQICLGDTNGSAIRSYAACDGSSAQHDAYPANCVFLDSPSTTSSTTYKVRFRGNNGNIVRLNRAGSDRSNGTDGVYASNITLMEIAA